MLVQSPLEDPFADNNFQILVSLTAAALQGGASTPDEIEARVTAGYRFVQDNSEEFYSGMRQVAEQRRAAAAQQSAASQMAGQSSENNLVISRD